MEREREKVTKTTCAMCQIVPLEDLLYRLGYYFPDVINMAPADSSVKPRCIDCSSRAQYNEERQACV